jgi:hypothetical protein
MNSGEGAGVDFATSRGRDWPSIRQFNVFLENRVGALLNVVRRFESTDIRIISLTVNDLADCAIIRIVLSDPERGLEVLRHAKLPVTESDLLVVQLPEMTQPLPQICKALLAAELTSITLTRFWLARSIARHSRCTSTITKRQWSPCLVKGL